MVSLSNAGLLFSAAPAVVHGLEVLYPTLSRLLANYVLPVVGFSVPSNFLTYAEQMGMYNAAINAAPDSKIIAAKDLLFVTLFEGRQAGAAFLSLGALAYYTFKLRLDERHTTHFALTVLSVLMTLANASHVGLPFGHHPLVSDNGWWVGCQFTGFWIASTYCNWKGFQMSRTAANKSDTDK